MNAFEATPKRTIQAIRPETVVREPIGRAGMVLGGKYRLEERIAAGGCASIWSATHVMLNRPVAVKFIETDRGAKKEVRVARFLREAKVAASVRHKNVVDILDFAASEDEVSEPYMIMELLEGESLDLRLGRTTVSTADTVSIIRQVLSGLDAVHAAGIVHRDMKPGNVFVTEDGDGLFARVLDFGISQELDAVDDHLVVGTPEYMSPEQAYGETIDGRSDLYSVGVMLYEMLGGCLPFEDPDPLHVLQLVVNETPLSLATLRPDLPALSHVVETAMARRPADRFQCAREMQRALVEAMDVEVTGPYSSVTGELRDSGKFLRETPTRDAPTPAVEAPIEPSRSPEPSTLRLPLAHRAVGVAIGLAAVVVMAGVAVMWNFGPATSSHAQVMAEVPPTVGSSPPRAAPIEAPSPPPEASTAVPAVAPSEPAPSEPVPSEPVASEPVASEPVVTPVSPLARARTAHRRRAIRTRRSGLITRELDF